MDIELGSEREPTHLRGLLDEGTIKISSDCIIPLQVSSSIIEAAERTPPHMDGSQLTVLPSQSLYSKTGGTCDMCGSKLDLDMLLDNPEVTGDPEHISLVVITESGSSTSNPLIVHQECLRDLKDELQQVLDNNPELVASVGL